MRTVGAGPPPFPPSPQPPPAKQLSNLALGAAAYSSSAISGYCSGGCTAQYAVDGNTNLDTQMLHTDGNVTGQDNSPWLSIDLGAAASVRYVRVYHRPGYLFRTQQSELRIGDVAITNAAADKSRVTSNVLVWKQQAELTSNMTEILFDPPVVGRWVTFQNVPPPATTSVENRVLQVLELQVFGQVLNVTARRFQVGPID